MIKAGFTGSRNGMTPKQKDALLRTFIREGITELHHGDCLGADAEAHEIAVKRGIKIALHPPLEKGLRAFCKAERMYTPRTYLVRNRHIVKETDLLIAAPSGYQEISRGSGTWHTIRKGRERHAVESHLGPRSYDVIILWPDGTYTHET